MKIEVFWLYVCVCACVLGMCFTTISNTKMSWFVYLFIFSLLVCLNKFTCVYISTVCLSLCIYVYMLVCMYTCIYVFTICVLKMFRAFDFIVLDE